VRPPYLGAVLDRAQESLELRPSAGVLDLAAGTGRLTRELARRFARVVAMEPDDEMRALIETGTVLAGRAEAIPLENRSADAAFVGEAFHWFETSQALAELARVLVPRGGLALISTHWWETEPALPDPAAALLREPYDRFYDQRPPGTTLSTSRRFNRCAGSNSSKRSMSMLPPRLTNQQGGLVAGPPCAFIETQTSRPSGNRLLVGSSKSCDQGGEPRDSVSLLNEGVGASLLHSPTILKRIRAAEDDDPDLWPALLDLAQDRVPVEPGHVQVKQDDRWLFGSDPREPGFAVACLADDELESLVVCERRGHAEPEERLVVDDQNPDHPLARKRFFHRLAPIRTLAPPPGTYEPTKLSHLRTFFKRIA
jgi:Methyltransferase domain